MKRKFFVGALLAGTCCFVAQQAAAVDFSFIPRASIGYQNYSIDWINYPDGKTNRLADISVNLATGIIGGTATLDNFYFDVYIGKSLEGSDDYTPRDTGLLTPPKVDYDVDVFDYAVTAGYNVWQDLAIFAGWKGHKTNLDDTWHFAVGPDQIEETEITYGGPFLGASYGWHIGDSNMLAINAAYAWLSGDIETKIHSGNYKIQTRNVDDGDAGGLTLGISWKGLITDALGYTVSADWYKYSFDDFTLEGGGTVRQEYDEEAYSLRFTVSYAF